jgi:DNA end-binding protein Ku
MRSIWTGALSFGLVNIPVKLYSASVENTLKFHYLHKDDNSPINYIKVCRADGKEVPQNEIVKGYEYRKGDFIIMTDEDFKKANARKTKTVDIVQFVNQTEIDPILYEKPYYLEPDKGAEKPYALLRDALAQSGKVAVANFVMRNREHTAVVKPVKNVLILDQMRFESEIRDTSGLAVPEGKADKKEIEMALALIEQLTGHFEASKFKDTYTEELQNVIKQKALGKPIKATEEAPTPTGTKDLMSMLKASLEKEHAKAQTASRSVS